MEEKYLFAIVTAAYLLIVGLGVGIFLWGKPEGNSAFDRLYQIVCIALPRLIKRGLAKCFGKRGPAALDAAWTYVCYRRNPIVQCFYVLMCCGGFAMYAYSGFSHLPNQLAGRCHIPIGSTLFVVCVGVWIRACQLDPGQITESNVDAITKVFECDEQIFMASECKTCAITKPGRTKHCSICNICVARFDHHCIWINNCVGLNNHRWFLAFLLCHLLLCLYGFALGVTIVYSYVKDEQLLTAVFVDPTTKERTPASWQIIAQYLFAKEGMLISVCILAGVMGLVLTGFFMWHLNLVRRGTTTSELSKWKYLKWKLKQDGDEGKEKLENLSNIYDGGLLANFKQVLFPDGTLLLPRKSDTSSHDALDKNVNTPEEKELVGKQN